MDAEEIAVLGEDDPREGQGVGDLLRVGRTEKPDLGCRGDVDAATPQARGYRPGTILIRMEAYCPGHWPSVP